MTTSRDLPLIQDRRPKLPEHIRQAVLRWSVARLRMGNWSEQSVNPNTDSKSTPNTV